MGRRDILVALSLTPGDEQALAARLLEDHQLTGTMMIAPEEVLALVADACRMGRAFAYATMRGQPACRVCGCTQDRACDGGCSWVDDDLCSSCAVESVEITDAGLELIAESMAESMRS